MKKLRILALGLFAHVIAFSLMGSVLAVDVINPVCKDTPEAAVCKDNQANTASSNSPIVGPNGIVTDVVQILVIVIGIVSVIAIMVAGIRLATSAGDADTAAKARKGIIYAVVGLLIALFAQAIVSFVLSKL